MLMNSDVEMLRDQLRDRIAADVHLCNLDILHVATPSARLFTRRVPIADLSLGESRIGGLPDLPPDVEWPRWMPSSPRDDKFGQLWHPERSAPLGFIAQIDLAAIPRIDVALPERGWLYFFYDRYCEPWGYDPDDRGSCRVIYADCDQRTLKRSDPPPDSDLEHVTEACRVEFRTELTLPDDLPGTEYGSSAYQPYSELRQHLANADGPRHQLLGYPAVIQNPMELECQLVSNGIYCGNTTGYRSEQAKALADGARDWRLLLQIDSDEAGPGWMWGDVGMIYFWIKRDDLASQRFDDVWLIFQCC